MKLSKVISNESIQFEVTPSEFDLISFALYDYACFIEYCLKNNLVNTYDLSEKPFELTRKIKINFEKQLCVIKPMQEILSLFY